MFLIMLAATVINYIIERHKLGYALRAIRESELAAGSLGVDVAKYRIIAFCISGFYAGLLGGIYALWINYVYPADAFAGLKTDQMFVMLLLGGMGNYLGPIIGSTLLLIILEILWTYWTEILYLIFLGVIIMITVILMPEGIIGIFKSGKTISIKLLLKV